MGYVYNMEFRTLFSLPFPSIINDECTRYSNFPYSNYKEWGRCTELDATMYTTSTSISYSSCMF